MMSVCKHSLSHEHRQKTDDEVHIGLQDLACRTYSILCGMQHISAFISTAVLEGPDSLLCCKAARTLTLMELHQLTLM